MKLTKRNVDSIEPTGRDFFTWDGDLKGFGLRVSPAGKKSFLVQYRVGGRDVPTRRVGLGAYGVVTPEEARERARQILSRVAEGVDPVLEEEASRDAARAALEAAEKQAAAEREAAERVAREAEELRLERVAERFLVEHVQIKRSTNTLISYRNMLRKHVYPLLGNKDARSISRREIADLHRSIPGAPGTRNRVLAILAAMYGWAIRMEILPDDARNPCRGIEKFKEEGRERYLSSDELDRLGRALRTAETIGWRWDPDPAKQVKHAPRPKSRIVRIDPAAAAAIRLLIFTGARLREILNLEWRDVDLERGLVRLRATKTGTQVRILNAAALSVLEALPKSGRYVIRGGGEGAEERPRADLKKPWAAVVRIAGLEGVTIHTLRHSFASVGAGDGLGLPIVGRLLGHASPLTTAKYAHLDTAPLRRASDQIGNTIAAAMGENVVPLRRKSQPA